MDVNSNDQKAAFTIEEREGRGRKNHEKIGKIANMCCSAAR